MNIFEKLYFTSTIVIGILFGLEIIPGNIATFFAGIVWGYAGGSIILFNYKRKVLLAMDEIRNIYNDHEIKDV